MTVFILGHYSKRIWSMKEKVGNSSWYANISLKKKVKIVVAIIALPNYIWWHHSWEDIDFSILNENPTYV